MLLLYFFGLVLKITVTAKSSGSLQKRIYMNTLYGSVDTNEHGAVRSSAEAGKAGTEWRYDNTTYWPGHLCGEGVGKRQSPINIKTETIVLDVDRDFIKYGELRLNGYQNVLVSAVNNGRTIQFTMEGDDIMHPTLTGGPLRYLYRLEQLHFHWLSEHAVDGFKYPMEIHFVHIRADLTTSEALRKRDGIAIIAVFGNIKSEMENNEHFLASDMLEEVVQQLPLLSQYGDQVSGIVMNMSKLLTQNQQSYVTYSGSLSSPECNEVVTWIILDNPVFMTYGQYKEFLNLAQTRYNFRRLQDSNVTVYRPSTTRYKQPMIFSVFANMYDVVASFFKSMNRMLANSRASKRNISD